MVLQCMVLYVCTIRYYCMHGRNIHSLFIRTVYTVLNIRAYRVISSDGYRLLQKPSRFCVSCVLRCVVWARAVGCLVSNHPPYPFKLFNRIETNYIKTMAVLSEFPSCTVLIDEWIHIYIRMYVEWIGVDYSGGSMVWYGMDVQLVV